MTARHVAALVSQFAPSASVTVEFVTSQLRLHLETSVACHPPRLVPSFLSLISAEMSVKSSFPLLYCIIMVDVAFWMATEKLQSDQSLLVFLTDSKVSDVLCALSYTFVCT